MGIGTLIFQEPPAEPLTRDWAEGLLAARINRLAAKASPEEIAEAEELVRAMTGGLEMPGRPGSFLVEWADDLRARAGIDRQAYPVSPDRIRSEAVMDPAKIAEIEEISLTEFLATVFE